MVVNFYKLLFLVDCFAFLRWGLKPPTHCDLKIYCVGLWNGKDGRGYSGIEKEIDRLEKPLSNVTYVI